MASIYYNIIRQRIENFLSEANTFADGADHRGMEGHFRELAIQKWINPMLTQSFQIGTGKIIDSHGNQSKQIDVVVYRKNQIPSIVYGDNTGYFPIESVRYAIEIKSKLTSQSLEKSEENLRSSIVLKPIVNCRFSTVLISLDSDLSNKSEIERLRDSSASGNYPIEIVVVLGRGYYVNIGNGDWDFVESSRDQRLSEFIRFSQGFMNTLAQEETAFTPFPPGLYFPVPEVN